MKRPFVIALLFGASLSVARADVAAAAVPLTSWRGWSREPALVIPLFLFAALYGSGLKWLRRATRSPHKLRRAARCFTAGWLALVAALLSPLHAMGGELFAAHMVQHELLVALAAPLVVLGRPWVVLPWALPRPSRHGLWRAVRRIRFRVPWLAHDFAAWIAHAAALWLWHVPALFQATLRSDALHALQHLSFLGTALWFWQAVFHGRHRHAGYGAGVFYLFTTAVHTTVLGALITFAGRAWYSPPGQIAMRWNLTPLEDQQLGGLIMWVPAGLAYVIAALVLFAKWLRETDRPTPLPLASANPPATAP